MVSESDRGQHVDHQVTEMAWIKFLGIELLPADEPSSGWTRSLSTSATTGPSMPPILYALTEVAPAQVS